MQEWTQALKPYCTNTQPKRVARTALPALTELRSLQIKVSPIFSLTLELLLLQAASESQMSYCDLHLEKRRLSVFLF